MRSIGNLTDPEQARLLGDYLCARGIKNQIEHDNHEWLIWIAAEEQLDDARRILEDFQANPTAPEFTKTAARADEVREREARDQEAYRRRFRTRSQVFPGTQPITAGVLTYSLIVLCVIIALFSRLGANEDFLQAFFITAPDGGGHVFLPEIRSGEIWRLFTPALIHFGALHLIFNMMWLFQLGSMIESRQGHLRFAALVVSLAGVSNFVEYGATHFARFGGMSGVVYGLFGYIWLRAKFDHRSGLYMHPQTVTLMIVWFFVCLSGWAGPIANYAHGAGLVMGAAIGLASALWANRQ